MPIKFRCQYCRQYLGISRAKAEQVVDCPTCGRSIRVPDLTGRVAPLPKPRLNLEDDSLVEALDRLAAIGEDDSDLVLVGDEASLDADGLIGESLDPIPVPEMRAITPPVPIDPPQSPAPLEPVVVAPPTAKPVVPVPEAVIPDSTRDTASRDRWQSEFQRAQRTGMNGALLFLVSVGCLCAGFLVGRFTAPVGPGPDALGTTRNPPAPAAAVREAKPAITGTVMFNTETGDSPDVGACVIALPVERGGTIRLSVVGFRPGDDPEDWQVARASLRALGGDASIVDDDGAYDLALPEAGGYQLLVLSRYQGRDTDEPIPAAREELLARFFDRPRQLLGQGRFEIQPIRWTGTSLARWSHTFPANES